MTALHGFLGLPSDWGALPCTEISEKPDWMPKLAGLPGSPSDPALAELAKELNSSASGELLLGYSMGGRIALHMLLADGGERWRRAIIVSASPGLKNPAERFARLEGDGQWARRFRLEPWDSVLNDWNQQPVFTTDGPGPLVRDEAEFDREQLALTLLRGSVGRQEDLREKLTKVRIPVLWIAGERDTRYANLARECAALNPRFSSEIIPNVGHRAPWTAPEAFCKAIGSSRSHNQ